MTRKRNANNKHSAEDGEFDVEKIVAYNAKNDSFRVRWLGFSARHDLWISRDDLQESCGDMIRAFEKQRSPSPSPPPRSPSPEEENKPRPPKNTKKYIQKCLADEKGTPEPRVKPPRKQNKHSEKVNPPVTHIPLSHLPLDKKEYGPRGIVFKEEESYLFSKLPLGDRERFPDKTKYVCCVLSLCISTPCIGIIKDSYKYVLKRAEWIHLSHIKKPWYRALSLTRVYGRFREEHGLCNGCYHAFDTHKEGVTDYLNILQHCNTCFICKGSHGYIKNNTSQVLGICHACKALKNDGRWQKCMAILTKIYPQENIVFKSEVKLVPEKTLDYLVTFKKDDVYGCILIEKDDGQHANRDAAQEKAKVIDQTIGAIIQKATQLKIPSKQIKCWFIRFGDHGMYNRSHEQNQNMMENISFDMRIVILRQWIIWYIEHFEEMRQTFFTYMWYNHALAKRRYPLSTKYEGALVLYDAPRNTSICPWRYAASPDEVREDKELKNEEKKKLIHNSVDMSAHEYSWHKKHESMAYPPEIKTRLQTQHAAFDI